ncbi:MAG TPA: UvrD-helicase domain-containing protein [Burkholderiales bacterium]|nr:UvrD-helicase domain-containing protein [Burkholderiales bacterium]
MSILSGLNPEQLKAVTLPKRSALVLAGAGSGKTRVLTTRIAWLIQTRQASPLNVLAVTFTNKAAREMLARISAMLPINTRGMWVGTFHGLCNRLLRAHYREAGLPQLFRIMDSADQLALIKRLMKGLNVDDEKYPAKQLQYFINDAKEQGLRAAQVETLDDFSCKLNELYAAYDELCQREGVVDFAELLLRSHELLSRSKPLREHYRGRFQHILVDELQDTSRLQYLWLKLLAGPDNTVFAVGDDDQSIYAFRGASATNMLSFESDFGAATVIKLEQNYRSHANILDAANALIRHNKARLGKNLWTAEGQGELLRLYRAVNDIEEAGFIVEEANALAAEGINLSDIAVLYRSNAQSRLLEHALFSAAIPYRVYGGLRFFERQEVKHALAYLRLVANPDDDGAVLRVINFPLRGIGSRSLAQLQEQALEQRCSLWQAALRRVENKVSGNDPVQRKGIEGFVALIEAMRSTCSGLALPEVIEQVIEQSGLRRHYQGQKDGADRLDNLGELTNAAATFVNENPEPSAQNLLADFLAHAALEAGEHQAGEGADALQLMTVHSAKGLEFHTVFISGLEEGLFPHEQSLVEAGGLEEERRLMYVALTRARRRLYLSFSQERMLHGQTRYGIASRFLGEIPIDLIKPVNCSLSNETSEPLVGELKPAHLDTAPAAFNIEAWSAWRVGQNVLHPKFGAGVIVNAEGRGSDARVQVNFPKAGVKWLALEYAKLTAA